MHLPESVFSLEITARPFVRSCTPRDLQGDVQQYREQAVDCCGHGGARGLQTDRGGMICYSSCYSLNGRK